MPRPTPPVKRVCYADDITVWASGPMIPQLESMINSYLRDVGIYLKENSHLISAPMSTVTLFIPDTHQFQTHADITLEDTQLPLERSPKILGVIMDPSLSFHKHYVTDRIDKINNMLKALAGCCCCLPTPMTLASGIVRCSRLWSTSQLIWPAVQSLRRGLSTNPGVTKWCVCGCS